MEDIQRLQRQLDEAQALVKATQVSLNEALLQFANQAEPRFPRYQSSTHPSTIDEDRESVDTPIKSKRRRESLDSRKTGRSTIVDGVRQRVTSVDYTGDSSDSDEGESFFAADPLPAETFDEDGLRDYLERYDFDEYSLLIMQGLFQSDRFQRKGSLFDTGQSDDDDDHDADVYEVDKDGAPRPKIREDSKKSGDHSQLWDVLRHTNNDETRTQKAVGRIVVMREPTPLLCAALHYTMSPHFDMDSIFRIMIDDTINTRAYVNGHASKDDRQQRSIVFMLKYHTLVGKDRTPLPWQNHDDDIVQTDDHVPISTCSTVVALSLSGKPSRYIRSRSRKSKRRDDVSVLYDPFNPWHVLSLQCFPDWHSETDLHETKHHYINGPDAFLSTLLNEYRDATKRFKALSKRVIELATPKKEVVFDSNLRDDLLFEHGNYMWSRRYFWAAQTLQILADEIHDMIVAYEETFTDEFWAGNHTTLFAGAADVSARFSNFRKKIAHTHKAFKIEIAALREVREKCNKDQKYVIRLREWLFSGTSVLESRSARKQDYNIKLLTLVTIAFLPLMFVTSVFGMTNMAEDENFVRFGWVAVCVCVPTYLSIVFISNIDALAPLRNSILNVWHKKRGKDPLPKHGSGLYKTKDRKKLKPIQKTATHSSLHRRLTSLTSDSVGPASNIRRYSHELRDMNQSNSVSTMAGAQPVQRRSTLIRWSEPFNTSQNPHGDMVAEPSPNTSDAEIAYPRGAVLRRTGSQEQRSPAAHSPLPRPGLSKSRSYSPPATRASDTGVLHIFRRLSNSMRSMSDGEVSRSPV